MQVHPRGPGSGGLRILSKKTRRCGKRIASFLNQGFIPPMRKKALHHLKVRMPETALQVCRPILPERHALGLQKCPLGAGSAGVKAGLCSAEAVHHPVAGDGGVLTARHGVAHRSGTPGHPGQTGHLAVGGYFTVGDAADDVVKRGKDPSAHFSRTSYRSVRRADRMGSCCRTASSRAKSRSAYSVVSSAPARHSTVPQGSTAMELP